MSCAPIANLDAIDVVGVRQDGGLDLVISCSGPLDCSAETLKALCTKITNYLREIREAQSPTLFERYNCVSSASVRIIISCAYTMHQDVLQIIDRMKQIASSMGVELLVKKRM